jgi:hypothetical protein
MEPDLSIMAANHFPSISELVKNDSLVHRVYYKLDGQQDKLFSGYFYGPVNKFPAPRAIVYQYVMKYLSFGSWAILVLIYWALHKRWNSKKKET